MSGLELCDKGGANLGGVKRASVPAASNLQPIQQNK